MTLAGTSRLRPLRAHGRPHCRPHLLVLAGTLASSLTFATAAIAQTSSEAMAESLFVEARRLMADGDFATACPKLRESNELDPQLGTLLNLGKCYEQNGQVASAWATFTELARLADRAGQAARASYASERIEALEPMLAYVTIRLVSPVPRVTVRIDDELLSTAVLGTPLPLDPGRHRLAVEAPDHEPWSRVLEVTPSSRQDVEVPPLERVSPEPARAVATIPVFLPPPPPPPSPPLAVHAEDTASSPWWPAAVAGYVVAGAGVVVGGVTGILALEAGGSLDCPGGACPPSDADRLSRATTLANVSNVGFAVAGASAIFAVVATVIAANDDTSSVSFRDGVLRF